MVNKKEKFLKNYLKYDIFKESLKKQQNKIIQLYNEDKKSFNSKNSSIIFERDANYYKNINQNQNQNTNNLNMTLETNNIFKIRLEQTKETLIELSKIKWPNIYISKNVLDLKGNVNIKIILLFKVF